MKLFNFIRSRSREQWGKASLELWTNLRIWIQENGELAAVLAFVGGVFLVLAFKLVLGALLLCLVLLVAAWLYALPESQFKKNSDQGEDGASLNGHSN